MSIGNHIRKIIKLFLILFATSLVGLTPLFRGLIFEREMGIHHYLVAMASILVTVLFIFEYFVKCVGSTRSCCQRLENAGGIANKGQQLPVRQLVISPYFLALATLTVLYGLSFFQAINSREGLFVWLRHLDYLLSFVLVFLAACIWEKDRQQANFIHWCLTIFALVGTVVATVGILTGQGIVSISGLDVGRRLSSTFQYPNSLAAYLMATVLMVIYLAVQNPRPLRAGAFAGMGFLTFLAILGSQSRGVWAILPFILALFIFGQTPRKKFVLLITGSLGLAIILSNLTVAPQVQQLQPNWGAFLWTLAGCLTTGFAWGGCVIRFQKVSANDWEVGFRYSKESGPLKKFAVPGMICAFLIIFAGVYLINNHLSGAHETGISGNPLLNRFMQINASDNSFRARMMYYADALKMVKDRPLLGWGGGGWNSGYTAYQSYNYISTTVHNHFLQVWVEAGTLGLIMFIIPFLYLSRCLLCLYNIRTTHPLTSETWTVGTAILALGIHSIIDFDLSFSSISLLLWALLALIAYREMDFKKSQESSSFQKTGAIGLIVLMILLYSLASICLAGTTFILRTAEAEAKACALAIQKGDKEAALEHIQVANRLDRWSAQYPIMQAQLLIGNAEHNPDPQLKKALAYESLNLVRRAVELDSYNPDNRFLLARLYLAIDQLENTLTEADQAKALKLWFIKTYEEHNSIYVYVAVQQLLRGQKEAAVHTLRQVLTVTREAVVKKETLSPRLNSLWNSRSDLTLTPALALTAGQSALLLEDHNQAKDFLTHACQTDDQKNKAVAQLWLGVALQKSGDLSGATLQKKVLQAYPDIENEYAILRQLVRW